MAKELNEGLITNELIWFPICDLNLEKFHEDIGWVLATDGTKMVPAFLGYGLFRKKPKWCSSFTRRPLDWTPTHIGYPTFSPPKES